MHYLIFERMDGHLMLFLFTLQLLLQFSDVLKSHTGRKIQCIFSMTVMDAAVCLRSINLCRCASVPESDPEALTAVFSPLPRVYECLSSYSLSGIHRSPCKMCNKWASILGNLAGWTWADLTWLAAIKSVCNFCTRRFMDLSSSSFLCWISSILVLWKQMLWGVWCD